MISVTRLSFETRLSSTSASSPISQLFQTMLDKKSNLCVAADLNSMNDILDLVHKIGDKICCLKLHYDVVSVLNQSIFLSDILIVMYSSQWPCYGLANITTLAIPVSYIWNQTNLNFQSLLTKNHSNTTLW